MIGIPYRVRYKLGFGRLVMGLLACGAGGGGMGYIAYARVRGIITDDPMSLPPSVAGVVYGGLGVACVFGGLALVFVFLKGIFVPTYFELTPAEVRLGKEAIPYDAMTKVEENVYKLPSGREKKTGLAVHAGDRKITIVPTMLPSDEVYQDVKAFLESRVNPAAGATYSPT
jgi:hypothetical protein